MKVCALITLQIDAADTSVVGEDGKVDLKWDAKFEQHMRKGEAISDSEKEKKTIHIRKIG